MSLATIQIHLSNQTADEHGAPKGERAVLRNCGGIRMILSHVIGFFIGERRKIVKRI